MTTEELRELDAWIAEHVIRFTHTNDPDAGTDAEVRQMWIHARDGCLVSEPYKVFQSEKYKHQWNRFNPTTDPAAAMQVLEKCAEKCIVTIEFGATAKNTFQWMVSRLNTTENDICEDNCKCARTLPLAIALFAKQLFHNTKETP